MCLCVCRVFEKNRDTTDYHLLFIPIQQKFITRTFRMSVASWTVFRILDALNAREMLRHFVVCRSLHVARPHVEI